MGERHEREARDYLTGVVDIDDAEEFEDEVDALANRLAIAEIRGRREGRVSGEFAMRMRAVEACERLNGRACADAVKALPLDGEEA